MAGLLLDLVSLKMDDQSACNTFFDRSGCFRTVHDNPHRPEQ